MSAPFSFGSQPQKRPHDWSAQMPPRIGADETAERGEAHDAVDHAGQRVGRVFVERRGEHAADDVDEREKSREERRGVADGDDDDVRREPEVGVEHGAHHLKRVAAEREMVRDEERAEADHAGRDAADRVAIEYSRGPDRARPRPSRQRGPRNRGS